MATAWDLAGYTDLQEGKLGKAIPPGRIWIPGRIWLEDAFLRWHLSPSVSYPMRGYVPPKALLNNFARLGAEVRGVWQASDQEILDFAERYGVLAENPNGVEGREPLERWRRISRSVLAILNVGAELAAGKKRITRDEWKWIGLFEEQYLSRLEMPAQARVQLHIHLLAWTGQVGLSLRLNRARARFELEVDYRGCMLSAVGLQLALTIANSDRLFICSGCGLPYARSTDTRRPNTGQSNFCVECGITAALRQADRRRKAKMIDARRLHASNVSVNEIAERLDTTPASVRRWVKKGR